MINLLAHVVVSVSDLTKAYSGLHHTRGSAGCFSQPTISAAFSKRVQMHTPFSVTRRLPLLAVVALLTVGINASAAESTYGTTVFPRAVEAVFQPGYRQLSTATQQLLESTQHSCVEPSEQSLSSVRDNFHSVVRAFARIELYRLGPMVEQLRQNRLFYWPDKRRVGERQLRKLLLDPASATLTESGLSAKSVALQGLPALERLLFGKHAIESYRDPDSPHCHVTTVIAQNMHTMATDIQAGWSDESTLVINLLNPSADSDLYRSEQEVLRQLVTQIVVGVDVVLNRKIAPLVGDEANVKKAPLWLSEHTLTMISENLEGIRALLIDSGLAATTHLEKELQFEFLSANAMLARLAALPELTDSNQQLTEDAQSLAKALSSVVGSISTTLNERFLKTLGISASFNSEDGD